MRTAPLQDRRIAKSIGVRTDAADLTNLNLRFSVDVRAPIVFKPSSRLVISTVEGQETRKRVLVRRADGENLEILSADTGDPTLVVVTEPVVKRERTNDYEAAPGDVWLELFLRPLIDYRPHGVRLWTTPSRSGDGYSGFVTLSRNGEGSFTITGIDVSHPEIFSAAVISAEPAGRQTVRVELAEGLGAEAISGTIEGWIEISTDDPIRPKLEVPVVVASSREGTRRAFPTRRRE